MGIFCEINLCKPADGKYIYQPGSIVSGAIRYYLDEEYVFTSIIVSFKGLGELYFEDKSAKRRDRMYRYSNNEVYIDINNVIHTNEKGQPLPVGQYETQFSFQLPNYIPASLDYMKDTFSYYARCNIQYLVSIKFERPGRFKLNKNYQKEINVISGQVPRLTTQPLIYGEQKNILQLSSLFSSKKGMVRLKATIANSVLKPGECVQIDYEVENSTNIVIKEVKVNMLEVDKYTSFGGSEVKVHSEVEDAGFTHGDTQGGETANFTANITVPELCTSIDHSKILSRDYSILTVVVLPMPHINLPLEIPFQVISRLSSSFEDNIVSFSTEEHPSDAPPTYWEAMGEMEKESHEKEDVSDSEEVKVKSG